MYTIVGKGFGLYGYLPAIMLNNEKVVLPSDYKLNIYHRKDLNQFITDIKWSQNIEEALKLSSKLILAIPPKDQFKFIHENIGYISDKTIFLEKPIASSPVESLILLKFLEEKKIHFYVNYSFIYLDWFTDLYNRINSLKSDDMIEIIWKFRAHFFSTNLTNWKSNLELGGGILRFYGIHLIAVLAALNYENSKIIKLKYDIETILFKIIDPNKPIIKIFININSHIDKFAINILEGKQKKNKFININDPFEKQINKRLIGLDRRVDNIRYYLSQKTNFKKNLIFNKKVINLWNDLEKAIL